MWREKGRDEKDRDEEEDEAEDEGRREEGVERGRVMYKEKKEENRR